MAFRIGSTVIHPHHGAAKIISKSKKPLNGKNVTYLELEVITSEPKFDPGMRIYVVQDTIEELGLRPPVTPAEAEDITALLGKMDNVRMPDNWSRRFKNHTSMLSSGDIYNVATVVRNLYLRSSTSASQLSAGERSLQKKAENLLASELAATWDTTIDEALDRIHDTMQNGLTKTRNN